MNQDRIEEIRQKIINLQAEAMSLKTQADKLIAEAQELSVRRLDVLEETQKLAYEYKKLKAPTSID